MCVRECICVRVCECVYLGHTGGIKAEHPLVAAGVYTSPMPALLRAPTRVHDTLRMVPAVGQLSTHKGLHRHTNTHAPL